MNERITLHDHSRKKSASPRVDVVIVNSRGLDHPWMKLARQSVQEQTYPNTSLLVVDNNDHALGIGQAFNVAVKASRAPFVQFLGDDDALMRDTIASMVECFQVGKRGAPSLVHTTTNCMLLHDASGQLGPAPLAHMGMFDRSWLIANPFNEALARGIHTDVRERLQRLEKLSGKPYSLPLIHHYGYMWRQHATMLSQLNIAPQKMNVVG